MPREQRAGRIAIAAGVVGLISVASLAVFFAVGGPFGSINDWLVGLLGVLSGLFAFALRRQGGGSPPATGGMATGVAIIGAGIVVAGSVLVISQTTGFMLAGLVESMGFALIGIWLIVLSRSMPSGREWPRRMASLSMVAGIVMAVGFVMAPGIAMGLDDIATAPGWIWIGFIGWVGIFFLYPIWAIWFSRVLRAAAAGGGDPG